tara:strand:+ start:3118 stop:4056 length:939 start_codon:yes stop_codon:yes gene_type:complete
MAIVKHPKTTPRQCSDAFPVDGYWVQSVEGLGRMTYSGGISPMFKVLQSTECGEYSGENKVKANGWSGIPKTAFKNGKNGTLDEVYQSMLSMPNKASEAMRSKVMSALPKSVRSMLVEETKWNDRMGEINLDRLFSGQRLFMRKRMTGEQNIPVFGIGVPIQANANINADIISIRAVVCALAVEILEKRGVPCEVFAISYCANQYQNGEDGIQAVRVKKAGELMQTSSIMNLMSGWAFRTAFFGMINYAGKAANGYGQARQMPDEKCEALGLTLPNLDGFSMLNTRPSTNNAETAIEEAIAELVRTVTPFME